MGTCTLDEETRRMLDEALAYAWRAGGYPGEPCPPVPSSSEQGYAALAQVCAAIDRLRGVATRLRAQLVDPDPTP